ncbi:hypothetical protein EON65_01995 [archaeon]|nr:MAG: hypothetical protein EON65_01995 [archaeon]
MIRTPNKINRAYSDKYIPGQGEYDLFMNKNVSWMNNAPFVNFFYLLLSVIAFGVIHVSGVVSWEDSWTVLNMLHGLVSLSLSHFLFLYLFRQQQ